MNRDLVGDEAMSWLEALPTPQGPAGLDLVRHGSRRTIYRATMALRDGRSDVLVKEHRHDPARSALTNAWCSRRAGRAANAAWALHQAGFASFEPVAALRSRGADRQWRAWLVLRPLEGTMLSTLLRGPAPRSQHARLLRAVAREVARLHDAGFYHGDLKPSNILVLADTVGHTPSLGFIDVDRTRRSPRWLSRCAEPRKALDLRTLIVHLRHHCATDEPALRELADEYFRARGFGPLRRQLWDAVTAFPHKVVTRTRRAKARRRGNPLPAGQNRLLLLRRLLHSKTPD